MDAQLPLLFAPESFSTVSASTLLARLFCFMRLRAGRFAGAIESGKSELLDILEGGEKRFEMLAVRQNAIDKPSAGIDDLTGELDIADQEPLELHPHDVSPCTGRLCHQPIPGFQVPSQSRDYHVGPVRKQAIGRHSQRIDAALQLPDHVLLVATIVGEEHNFFFCHLAIIGDVKEVPIIPISELPI